MSRLRGIVFLTLATVLTACPQKTAVWVRSGSTADNLIFDFGRTKGLKGAVDLGAMRVERCAATDASSGASWVLWPMSGTIKLDELRYGELPQGFAAEAPASDLTPGCYAVVISGTGRSSFTVDSVGSVTEATPSR